MSLQGALAATQSMLSLRLFMPPPAKPWGRDERSSLFIPPPQSVGREAHLERSETMCRVGVVQRIPMPTAIRGAQPPTRRFAPPSPPLRGGRDRNTVARRDRGMCVSLQGAGWAQHCETHRRVSLLARIPDRLSQYGVKLALAEFLWLLRHLFPRHHLCNRSGTGSQRRGCSLRHRSYPGFCCRWLVTALQVQPH